MANLRTFYACQAVAVAPLIPNDSGVYGSGLYDDFKFIHGVQSVGLNSSFDFENIFELGQLEIYDAVLNIPEIEITIEKVLDGYKTVYGHISSGQDLAKASKHRASVRFAVYGDENNAGSNAASGNLLGYVECTGMYVNNVTYTFPVDGNCTESVTLVGNHKQWYLNLSGNTDGSGISIPDTIKNDSGTPDDRPVFGSGSTGGLPGRVVRRQDVKVTSPGSTKAQNVTLTLNLGREDVFEFGKRIPYAKIATYPIEVTSEIQSLAVSGSYDDVSFTEETYVLPDRDKTIKVEVSGLLNTASPTGVLTIDLGKGNFLTSISHAGGDAGGGNATVTRNYTCYNTFKVTDNGLI